MIIGIGALGMMPRGLEENQRTLRIRIKVELIQKVALLGTARILRKKEDTEAWVEDSERERPED